MRHGQTDWNVQGKTGGNEPIPLNENGRRQAALVQDLLPTLPISSIYYSPTVRGTQTMEIACKKLTCPRKALDGFKEWNYGDWVGQPKDEYILAHYDTLQPPHGETREQFLERTVSTINDILSHAELPFIVAHLGTYWALCRTMQIPFEYLANCQLVNFTHHHRGWQREFLNYP